MKYKMMGLLTLALSLGAFAQEKETPQTNNRNSYKSVSSSKCNTDAEKSSALCLGFGYLTTAASADGGGRPGDPYKSVDGRFNCVMKTEYTADFKNCKTAVNLYNGVMVAEKGMQMQQSVRTDLNNKKIAAGASEKAAAGDAQGAAFDAAVASTGNVEQMYKEQAMMYGAAVAALSSQVSLWKKKSESSVKKSACAAGKQKVEAPSIDGSPSVKPTVTCEQAVVAALQSEARAEIFANDSVKAGLILAAADYTMKAAKATKMAMDAHQQGKNLQKVSDAITEEDQDLMLEMCVVNPTHPDCISKGNRVGGNYSSGSGNFGMGDGGSNAFNMGDGTSEFGDPGAAGSNEEIQNVASINSPFNDDIKTANGILNPAPAAAVTPGGGAGGGGGGGGGGMGGGSASLGGDLNGEDKAKADPEIKSGKGGAYASAGGGGKFTAVAKGSGDEANPFASLFDQKEAAGGVVEDRDIASASDGPGSGLFQKISKRYGQVQADKRIEANNLE